MGGSPALGCSFHCMGEAAKRVASRSPNQSLAAMGGRKRSGPTGGSAKGIPRKMRTLSADSPRSVPLGVWTIVGVTSVSARKRRVCRLSAASEALARKARREREWFLGGWFSLAAGAVSIVTTALRGRAVSLWRIRHSEGALDMLRLPGNPSEFAT